MGAFVGRAPFQPSRSSGGCQRPARGRTIQPTERPIHRPSVHCVTRSSTNQFITTRANQNVLGVSHCDQGRVCRQLSPLAPVSFFCPNRPYLVDQVDRLLSRDASMRPGSQFSVQLSHVRQPLVRFSGLRVRQRAHFAGAMELVVVSQIFSVTELSAGRWMDAVEREQTCVLPWSFLCSCTWSAIPVCNRRAVRASDEVEMTCGVPNPSSPVSMHGQRPRPPARATNTQH